MNPWRSLSMILDMYEMGALSRFDLVTFLLGVLDVYTPDEVFSGVPAEEKQYFMIRARGYAACVENDLRNGRKVLNEVTGEPMPDEALRRFLDWVAAKKD